MSVLAHFEPLEQARGDRRGAPRFLLSLGSQLGPCGSSVTIHDLSASGLLFETSTDLTTGDTIEVHLPEMGPTRAIVVWRDGSTFGCQFDKPIPAAAVSAALLRSEPAPAAERPDVAAPATNRPTDAETPLSTSRDEFSTKRHGWVWMVAALGVFAVCYLVLTDGLSTLSLLAAASSLLIALLVAWGVWVLNNTLDL